MSDDEEYEYEYGSDAEYDYGSDQENGGDGDGNDIGIEIENSFYGENSVGLTDSLDFLTTRIDLQRETTPKMTTRRGPLRCSRRWSS